jgi:chloride channel, nucleotide-sensitive, 1A
MLGHCLVPLTELPVDELFDVFCHCAELNPDPNAGKLSLMKLSKNFCCKKSVYSFQFSECNGENGWFHGEDMADGGWVHGDDDMVVGKYYYHFYFAFSC